MHDEDISHFTQLYSEMFPEIKLGILCVVANPRQMGSARLPNIELFRHYAEEEITHYTFLYSETGDWHFQQLGITTTGSQNVFTVVDKDIFYEYIWNRESIPPETFAARVPTRLCIM